MDEQELLPCPFCGHIPEYDEEDTIGSSVTCHRCGTDGPWKKGQESHKSIAAWNTRAKASKGLTVDELYRIADTAFTRKYQQTQGISLAILEAVTAIHAALPSESKDERRVAACIKACEDWDTEELERGLLNERFYQLQAKVESTGLRRIEEDIINKDERIKFLENELADALDVKIGDGPTALSMLVASRDRLTAQIEEMQKVMARINLEWLHNPDMINMEINTVLAKLTKGKIE
jgi:hypothetical protein